ncbi:TIGR04219 family outer membrane beta-barrel protein [Oceanospirillaceae bacterium ASx5O]|nr:TIGR04219 family outer membrane beta-barrel protein [Oceanospirillaceae bacterium ASx5O]
MKKTALAAAILAMAPVAAQADLLFTVGAKASVWNAEATGQLDDGLSVEEDGLNLDSDNGNQITVFFEHPLPFIPNVKLKQTALEVEGNGTINATFADQNFNEAVATKLDLAHTDLTLYWGLPLPLPYIDINFGLTARQFDGSASVSSKTAAKTESVDLDLTLPMAYGEVKVGTPFGIYAAADVNYIGFGDNKITDMSATIGYDLPIPVVDIALEGGYRSLSLQTDSSDVDIDADMDIKGAFFGASLSLGF